ncbi:hypothetical protein [Laspinema olomoucense]|uniref:Uncharacterized protein n=1 Tax=Laspinema olomoucense D3b TaxID=2953688 RepID=A0ABT2N0E5_9CYAN|nr:MULTISPECIES: hypothetical protein [unclassified Laspinema]MCT7974365.1 hypothetical protein [Laspinema sp. D3d]MCT7976147.1 hypothetical protein [Laspinema sp. D3b]MCT7990744.1 hypothetical protein [Laspinema sp. D3a]MCT7994407.1 hypothetical protein [Laspinema sp. D3c]
MEFPHAIAEFRLLTGLLPGSKVPHRDRTEDRFGLRSSDPTHPNDSAAWKE